MSPSGTDPNPSTGASAPASYRLSCRTTVNGDVTIRTRPDAGVGKGSNSLLGAIKQLVGR